MGRRFFEKINYSACNEDSESERMALQLTDQDTLLCITGSGARPLDLLIDQPKKIISVDINPAQNNLLSLKIAAYKSLNYTEFKTFVGLEKNGNLSGLYAKLSGELSPEIKNYWNNNFELIENGLLYAGKWERLLHQMSKATLVRKEMLQKLMESETLENQAGYWNKYWDNGNWQFFLKLICQRSIWTKIIREPGMSFVPKDFKIDRYLHTSLNHLAHHFLLRENHFANLLFYGRYQHTCILPIHLQEIHFDTIRKMVDRIDIVTSPLIDVLKENKMIRQVTAYSLSDFSSYTDEKMYASIWTLLASRSQPGARFCERQFLVKRSPETLHQNINRNQALEEKLNQMDSTAIYTFIAGYIKRNNIHFNTSLAE